MTRGNEFCRPTIQTTVVHSNTNTHFVLLQHNIFKRFGSQARVDLGSLMEGRVKFLGGGIRRGM